MQRNRILRVNLTTGSVSAADAEPELLRSYVGGRGLGVKLLYDELKPGADPLGEENKLVFAAGPLTGLVQAAGKSSVVSKSPLTGTAFDSTIGGNFGMAMRRAGYIAIVVEGKAGSPRYILIEDEKVFLGDATQLWGKTTSETEEVLGPETACIGPAGENLVRFAGIFSRASAAGRGGLGAVMGAKQLKAITVRSEGKLGAANEYELQRFNRQLYDTLRGHPVTGDSLGRFGTLVLLNIVNKFGILPVQNFSQGQFAEAEKVSGETISKLRKGHRACYGCAMACKRDLELEGKAYDGVEYESLWALGPDTGTSELRGILEANQLCNEMGMDTISTGSVIAFAIELQKRGILKKEQVGFELDWGDSSAVLKLIGMIARREGIGKELAEGSRRLGEKFGGLERAAQVKGLELPAYDPRGMKGQALSYATSNRGGCHLRAYIVPQEVMGNPVYLDNLKEEGKAALVKKLQDISAMLDSLVLCKFTTFAVFNTLAFECDLYARLLTAATGFYFDEKEFLKAGERIYNLERLFNLREGFGKKDDALPERFGSEPIPAGPAQGHSVRLDRMLPEYYGARGWDENGVPTDRKLQELGLPFEEKFPKLQVALDLREREEALRIAGLAARGGVDIIEAGTPLIKMCGMEIVGELKRRFPNKTIVADMKTADTGYLEAEMAAKAGADVVCVLGASDDATIADAVGAARKYGIKVEVDLISIPKERLVERARQVEKLGADYICFHIGVDRQMRSDYEKIPFPTLKEVAGSVKIPVAAAGGLKGETIPKAVESGAKIIIAGGAITRAGDPEKATKSLLSAMGR